MKYKVYMNKKTGQFLNYAEKRKKLFCKGIVYHIVTSPHPTFRLSSDNNPEKWLAAVDDPREWKILEIDIS